MPAPRIKLRQLGIGGIQGSYKPPKEPVEEVTIFNKAQKLVKPSAPARVAPQSPKPDLLNKLLVPPAGGLTDRTLRGGAQALGETLYAGGTFYKQARSFLDRYQTLLDALGGRNR